MLLFLLLWTAGVGIANYRASLIGIDLDPLFILPICLVSWYSSFRIGLAAAFASALVSVGTHQEISPLIPWAMAGLNLAIHALSFIIIAAVVSQFRADYERVRFVGRCDYVTGVLNRQAFEQKAEEMLRVGQARGWPMLLVYLDLDGFKSVNDRYGHEAGDEVLKRFAVEGRAALRREDCFGRMGGDEFALLMKLPSIDEGQEVAENLHRRFSAVLADTGHRVTCSMGAVAIEPCVGGAPIEYLMRNVDDLMYTAKRGGKDGLRYARWTWSSALRPPLSAGDGETPPKWPRPNRDARHLAGGS
ncbi:GGDEF domain-containing protein [Rhizobium sp. ZPR3]|uniref:diguanylate cyclase n=2 Tax=unclassified Rhizobium TaxID=2613769 RepID=A0AAU7SRG0_9HYPH